MKKYTSYARILAVAIIVVAIGALAGWYYFLHGAENTTSQQYTEAGYGVAAPTFEGSDGSSYQNIVSTLGAEGVTAASSTSRLWEVSAVPVAGFGWTSGASGSSPSLYFVERSSGYVFDAETGSRTVARLTDTLRPKIYQAFVTQSGDVVERSIDDDGALITFAGTVATSSAADITSTSSPDELQGNDLPQNILAIAADPSSGTLYYLIQGPSGASLVSTNIAGTGEKALFSSPITGWRILAPGDGDVYLLQDPLDNAEGYVYQVHGGALSLIAQGPGLTALPDPSSGALILGTSQNGVLSLYAQASASSVPVNLSLSTVADKCAWASTGPVAYCGVPQTVPSQQFLDDWYKGLVHTSDEFYTVNASQASTTLLYDPAGDTDASLDVEDPSVDPTGQYIAFINAADQSLWVLRIAQ